jgi:endogenous inhibitor of DNA gyrase (YacG/DUF329 family)
MRNITLKCPRCGLITKRTFLEAKDRKVFTQPIETVRCPRCGSPVEIG